MKKSEMVKLWFRVKAHNLKTIGRDYLRFMLVAGFVMANFWGWSAFFKWAFGGISL